jgi:hypothetical protein
MNLPPNLGSVFCLRGFTEKFLLTILNLELATTISGEQSRNPMIRLNKRLKPQFTYRHTGRVAE